MVAYIPADVALSEDRLGAAFHAIGVATGPRQALEALLRSAGALFHADLAAAHVHTSGAAGRLALALEFAGDGTPKPLPAQGAAAFGEVLEWPAGAAVLIEDAAALNPHDTPAAAALLRTGRRSLLAVPIAGAGGTVGTLVLVQRQPGAFDRAALAVTAALARQAAEVIERVRLVDGLQHHVHELQRENAHLHQLAVTDDLTGLANRRAYDVGLQREWRRALRHRTPLSLLFVDIDRFKSYNDTFGHEAGDDCLRKVAAVVGNVVHRPGDLAARYGGEEFLIMAAETSIEEATRLGEVVRARIEGLGIVHVRSDVSTNVTVSIGVATTIPRQHQRPAALLSAADAALYAAKRAGGNRVLRGIALDAAG
ncbi:MAG TPA: diguanylate cyclase [Chloroflexota bacterium]|jgi:diguanylate cyclase (GGDEF)-like protein